MIMKMNDKQKQRWEATRAKGKSNFIWTRGVLGWGGLTAVLFAGFVAFRQSGYDLARMSLNSFLMYLMGALIVFPIGGYFWGLRMWDKMEEMHSRQ